MVINEWAPRALRFLARNPGYVQPQLLCKHLEISMSEGVKLILALEEIGLVHVVRPGLELDKEMYLMWLFRRTSDKEGRVGRLHTVIMLIEGMLQCSAEEAAAYIRSLREQDLLVGSDEGLYFAGTAGHLRRDTALQEAVVLSLSSGPKNTHIATMLARKFFLDAEDKLAALQKSLLSNER